MSDELIAETERLLAAGRWTAHNSFERALQEADEWHTEAPRLLAGLVEAVKAKDALLLEATELLTELERLPLPSHHIVLNGLEWDPKIAVTTVRSLLARRAALSVPGDET